jgi:glycosyltransferase involved in cell wall biosynthesis
MSVSVLILTLNEEIDLPDCLQSAAWSDDVVVFDSLSTDRTVEIARAAAGSGVRLFQRAFDDYASQRNAALSEVQYRYPWVLMVDADERVTPELAGEIQAAVERGDPAVTLYRVRRKDMFFGRWLRRSSGYPTWFGRLARVGHVTVKRAINEEYHTDGAVGFLQEHLVHYPFSKGIRYWIERHNRYSTMEAQALIEETQARLPLRHLWSKDPAVRRKFFKQLAYRIPGRPLLAFCYLYFARLGFLDGRSGWRYCILRAMYEYMLDLKVRELRRRAMGEPL